jgi:hypothetical protein
VAYGKLDPVSGLGVVGFGLSIAGFSAKANRHQAELLTALQGVAQAAVDIRSGNSAGAVQLAEKTALSLVPPLVTNSAMTSTSGDQVK